MIAGVRTIVWFAAGAITILSVSFTWLPLWSYGSAATRTSLIVSVFWLALELIANDRIACGAQIRLRDGLAGVALLVMPYGLVLGGMALRADVAWTPVAQSSWTASFLLYAAVAATIVWMPDRLGFRQSDRSRRRWSIMAWASLYFGLAITAVTLVLLTLKSAGSFPYFILTMTVFHQYALLQRTAEVKPTWPSDLVFFLVVLTICLPSAKAIALLQETPREEWIVTTLMSLTMGVVMGFTVRRLNALPSDGPTNNGPLDGPPDKDSLTDELPNNTGLPQFPKGTTE